MYHVYRNQAAAAYSVPLFLHFSFQFSNIKIFRHIFSGTLRSRRLKLGTHVDSGQMYRVYWNQAADAYLSFYFIFLSLHFSNKIFCHTRLTNCEVSQTVRSRRLKLGTHSGQMYHVYWNQAAAAYSSLYFFIFLSNFQTLKFFVTLFSGTVRPRWLKPETHTGIRLVLLICPFISSLTLLSNFQTLKYFVTLFSATVRPRRLKLGTHMDSGQMYRVYRNQAAAAYLSLYFFIFLSLQLSNIKNFRHIFLRNCEV